MTTFASADEMCATVAENIAAAACLGSDLTLDDVAGLAGVDAERLSTCIHERTAGGFLNTVEVFRLCQALYVLAEDLYRPHAFDPVQPNRDVRLADADGRTFEYWLGRCVIGELEVSGWRKRRG
jgi:hypothetical protein